MASTCVYFATLLVCYLFLQFILCLLVSTYMASLWEKALHVQISLCVVVHQNGAHKRYKKNATEERETPKIGDAVRFTEPSAAVRSGLYVQRDMASSMLGLPGVLWAISCPGAVLVHWCGAELNPVCSGVYREKGHV